MTREQAEEESERWQQVSHSYHCQQRTYAQWWTVFTPLLKSE
jgi:hypothetical protein